VTSNPTDRALVLLSLLQSRPSWAVTELADRLGTSARTLRRDAHRLRELGYAIETRPGPGSSYRLLPGLSVPPLLFSPDEISAIVTALRARLDDAAAASALAKLDQVLPPTLRRRAAATDLATEVLDGADPLALAAGIGLIADAVAEQGRIRFGYLDPRDTSSIRLVEPYRHVLRGGHWYLIAYDVDRGDWRTYRLDRVSDLERVPGSYRHRNFPHSSVQGWFASDFGRNPAP
jgi:predicted DNA-binding transcriptional regulator YafY